MARKGDGDLIAGGIVMLLLALIVNGLVLAGGVWIVVKVLQALGVI